MAAQHYRLLIMTTTVSRLLLSLALAGLVTLPAVSQAAVAVGWQKAMTEAFSGKTSVRVASTGNLTLSGLQAIDGWTLTDGDRVLVKDQTLPAQNGIYVASSGAWVRATDSDHWGKFIGANVVVAQGSVNGRSEWLATAVAGTGSVLGTSSLTFAKKAGATTASLAALASSGLLVNSAGSVISRNLVSGSARLSLSNADGVAGNPTLDVVEAAIAINNLNGTLTVAKGGTGATTFTDNGVVYGDGSGVLQATVAGTSGQLLVANASGVPTFVSLVGDGSLAASGAFTLTTSGVTAGAYGSATTAPVFSVDAKGRITSASSVTITPAWTSVTGKPTTVAGYGITALDLNAYAPTLTGTGATGTWGINVTGSATKLATARTLSVTGDATWSTTFDGSANATGVMTLANSGVTAGTYGSATSAPVYTVDAKGRLISASNVTVTPAWTSVTGKPTSIAGYGITPSDLNNYAPALNGVGASGTWGISITGSAATANQVSVDDTRSAVNTPESYGQGVHFDFKSNSANGLSDGGSYNGVMTFRKWGSGTDWSGGAAHQLGFTENGELWMRTGSSLTWGGWQKMVDSANVGTFAPSLTGSGASGTWGISVTGNAATATKLVTARTISATGDATWSANFDGSANVSGALTLANSGVAAGTYGSATTSPVYAVDAKGRITSATNVTITPAWANVTSKPTTIGGYGITDLNSYAPTLTGGGASGTWGINITGNANTLGTYGESSFLRFRGELIGDAGAETATGVGLYRVAQSGYTGLLAQLGGVGGSTPSMQLYATYGDELYFRASRDSQHMFDGAALTSRRILHSYNIGEYAPSLTGYGASGNWNINIGGGLEALKPSLGYSEYGQDVGFSSHGGPQVRSQGNGAAMMSFHRPGYYAVNFGLGMDNQLRVGGWSRGGSYVVLDSGNFTGFAPSLTGAGASGTWGINVTGNAGTATRLATARSISITGDATWSTTFDGSANATGVLTLANTGVAAGTYGSATASPVYSVDSKGRITSAYNATITPAWGSVTGKPTTIAGYIGTDAVDVANITQRVGSGFYQYGGATQALGWPTNSNGWYHLMSSTHSNGANYYAMQLAADFYSQDLYYRSTNGNGATAWNRVLTSANAGYALAMNQHVRTSDSPTFQEIYSNGWFRSNGNAGWYNQAHGGGIWMQDSTWIRTYGSKSFYVQGGNMLVDGTVYAGGTIQARGGVSNDQGNLSLSAAGGTIVANNQMQLWAGASSGAACGVAGAIARDGSNNVYVCK